MGDTCTKPARQLFNRNQSCKQATNKYQEPPLLSHKEKQLIIELWLDLQDRYPDFIRDAWQLVADSHPEIRATFGDNSTTSYNFGGNGGGNDNGSSSLAAGRSVVGLSSFDRAVVASHRFLDKLIIKEQLDDVQVKHMCWMMGVSHCLYLQQGFKSFYWDAFQPALNTVVANWALQHNKTTCPAPGASIDSLSVVGRPSSHIDHSLPLNDSLNNSWVSQQQQQRDSYTSNNITTVNNNNNNNHTSRKHNNKAVMAWAKFVEHIINIMKMGYDHQRIVES